MAVFRLLDRRAHDDLVEARRRFPEDHLLLGVLYARYGIRDRAREELTRYANEVGTDRARALSESMRLSSASPRE
jgi:hypothetical protein